MERVQETLVRVRHLGLPGLDIHIDLQAPVGRDREIERLHRRQLRGKSFDCSRLNHHVPE